MTFWHALLALTDLLAPAFFVAVIVGCLICGAVLLPSAWGADE